MRKPEQWCSREKRWAAKTQILQERWGANAGRTCVRPPAPHFPAQKGFLRRLKREADGREGAISGEAAKRPALAHLASRALASLRKKKVSDFPGQYWGTHV